MLLALVALIFTMWKVLQYFIYRNLSWQWWGTWISLLLSTFFRNILYSLELGDCLYLPYFIWKLQSTSPALPVGLLRCNILRLYWQLSSPSRWTSFLCPAQVGWAFDELQYDKEGIGIILENNHVWRRRVMWCHGVSIIYFWQLIVESEDYSCLLQLQLCEQSFLYNLQHYIQSFSIQT
jgi:hypothetical protein